jgi:hypothetical protein
MHKLILAFLGPFAGLSTAFVCLLVWRSRQSLRPRHVLILALLSALGIAGFFLAFLAMWAGKLPSAALGTALLYASGSIAVGCGTSVLLTTALIRFGHAVKSPPRTVDVHRAKEARSPVRGHSPADLRKRSTAPTSALQISEQIRARKRLGMWMSGLFVLVAMPTIAVAILFSLSKAIRSGYMTALRVVNQANPTYPGSISLADAPGSFAWQALLIGSVAGLCLYWAYLAGYHVFTGFKHHPDYPRHDV